MVFPMIGFRPDLSYLVLLVVFWVLGYYFNRWLQSSLKRRPGSRSSRRRGSSFVTPGPASGDTLRSVPGVKSRPALSARSASPRPAPVSRFAYCRRYPDLLALCAGDVFRADRLVDVESKCSASAAPDVWVNLAISRLSSTR